jgi:putative transposase
MTLPRQVIPGQFLFLTRRTTQQQYLLRPHKDTNQTYLYCLGLAAERCQIELMLPVVMSNHHHLAYYDRFGRSPEFTELLHKLIARARNRGLGRRENFWSSAQPSVVRIGERDGEREDVIRRLVYIATNPVKANLVDRAHHWPGVKGLSELLSKREITVKRPTYFFRSNSNLPDSVTIRFVVPAELGDTDAFLAEVRERVRLEEDLLREARLRAGKRVYGRNAVKRMKWTDSPLTAATRTRGKLNPTLAIKNREARVVALARDRQFRDEYRIARRAWSMGAPAVFPSGTYWLKRFAHVPIAEESGATT